VSWIERLADRLERADAFALEELAQLAVDGGNALCPRIARELGWHCLDRTVEVVGDGEHLADQGLAGEPEPLLALLARPAAEVAELRALALERLEVLVGLLARRRFLLASLVELALELLDLGEQLG